MEGPDLSEELRGIWDLAVRESQLAAALMRRLAPLWVGRDAEGALAHEGDVEDAQAAVALRTTTTVAYGQIRDAHEALTLFPLLFARVEAGELPVEWLRRVIHRSRDLPEDDRKGLDRVMGDWEFGVTPETFRRLLGELITWFTSLLDLSPVERAQRRRHIGVPVVGADGTASLTVTGPVPEILAFAQSLDAAAETLQSAQRHALDEGPESEVPFDEDGSVRASGKTMTRGRLRYEALLRGEVNTDGHEVPSARFAILVTIPFLSLLGRSEAPALLEGKHPIPADMARELAGGCPEWMRVLTDPVSGAFLPLPPERYRPSPQMVTHVRLRGPECAVPGCGRASCRGVEVDHIEEFDHDHPGEGGVTEIENLHVLCWSHHQVKTAHDIDPVRLRDDGKSSGGGTDRGNDGSVKHGGSMSSPVDPGIPVSRTLGRTHWSLGDAAELTVQDQGDLMTPLIVRELETAWHQHLATTAHAPELPVDADPSRPSAPTSRATCDPPF
ncbi:HNH endonuclease [Brachybacterium halotolerans subsp. kimchii]|uniref:HNH endonuclease signature motif containing protein n=1 Tax=Brachybacterium halotolerans TaxID=2795215 RepID=UPI001E5EF69C|nr:HNH endonuclease signature motif containing protein [Brachybacterium halotolerans]UEJ82175.1 HNH endonuclease [Brachybacterium halotolerans subsp. kimchii]